MSDWMHWFVRAVASWGTPHFIKLSFSVHRWCGWPLWTLTYRIKTHPTRRTLHSFSPGISLKSLTSIFLNNWDVLAVPLSLPLITYIFLIQTEQLLVCKGINTIHTLSSCHVCLCIKGWPSSHTPLSSPPPLFLLSGCDLCIVTASLGCCCLFSFSHWEYLVARCPQGRRQK